jgi:hypothetical protein
MPRRPTSSSSRPPSPRLSSWLVAAMLGMIAVPAYFTLHTVCVSSPAIGISPDPSPYGYSVSLLLFIVPIAVIAFWFVPQEELKVSRKAFWWTIGLLFPLGALLDFLFANRFFRFPTPARRSESRLPPWETGCRSRNMFSTSPASSQFSYFTSGSTNTGFLLTACPRPRRTEAALTGSCGFIRHRSPWR